MSSPFLIIAFPFSIVTVIPSGRVPPFLFLSAFSTDVFTAFSSSGFKAFGSVTSVFSGTMSRFSCGFFDSVTFFVASEFSLLKLCVAVIVSSLFNLVSSGTVTDHVPSCPTVTSSPKDSPEPVESTLLSWILAPGVPVPVIVLLAVVTSLIVGSAVT